MNLKFFYPFVGLCLGIYLTSDIMPYEWGCLLFFGLAIIIWLVLHILTKNPLKAFKYSKYHSIWIILLFSGLGSLDYLINCKSEFSLNQASDNFYYFKGRIIAVNTLAEGDKFKVKIKDIRDSKGISVNFRNVNLLVNTNGFVGNKGDIISFKATPKLILNKDTPTPYSQIMYHQGIQYYVNVKSDEIIKTGKEINLIYTLSTIRDRLIILIEKASLEKETKSFLISILLGNRTFLSSETKNKISAAGLSHVLALSGMHITIILSIILLLLYPLSFFRYNKSRKVIAIFFVWIYVMLTGATPSTIRAGLMATLVMGAYMMERRRSALNALFASILIIVLLDPFSIWDIGLQLSFLCVASIIIFTNKLNPVEQHKHPKLYSLINLILITLITTFCTWPVIAYYFKSVPLLFLPTNIILLPLIPLFITIGLFYTFLLILGIDSYILGSSLDYFYNLFIGIIDILSFSGTAKLDINIPYITVILWLVGLFIIVLTHYSRQRKEKKLLTVFASLFIIISISSPLLYSKETNSSIKYIHSFNKIIAKYNDGFQNSPLEFPRRSISKASNHNLNIISVDSQVDQDSLHFLRTKDSSKYNCIIIGPEANMNQVADLINSSSFSIIILHSGIGKNKRSELIHLLDRRHHDKIYSLRDNGSLEFDL